MSYKNKSKERAYNKKYRHKNRAHLRKKHALWWAKVKDKYNKKRAAHHFAHRDEEIAYRRIYRKKNRDRILAKQRAWYKAHPTAARRYYYKNAEKIRAQAREYYYERSVPRMRDWRREAERSIAEMKRGQTRPFERKTEAIIFCIVGRRLGYSMTLTEFKEGYRVRMGRRK